MMHFRVLSLMYFYKNVTRIDLFFLIISLFVSLQVSDLDKSAIFLSQDVYLYANNCNNLKYLNFSCLKSKF